MDKRAFTLVELLVVMAILAILMAIFLPGISHLQSVAKATKTREIAVQVAMAWEAYVGDVCHSKDVSSPDRESDGGFAMTPKMADDLNRNENRNKTEINRERDIYFERSPIQTKYGILTAWGLADAKAEKALDNDCFIWAKLDMDFQGFIEDPSGGAKVRKNAIAWAAYRGKDDAMMSIDGAPSTEHIRSW